MQLKRPTWGVCDKSIHDETLKWIELCHQLFKSKKNRFLGGWWWCEGQVFVIVVIFYTICLFAGYEHYKLSFFNGAWCFVVFSMDACSMVWFCLHECFDRCQPMKMKITRRVASEEEILFFSTNFGDVLSSCITDFLIGADLGGVWFCIQWFFCLMAMNIHCAMCFSRHEVVVATI